MAGRRREASAIHLRAEDSPAVYTWMVYVALSWNPEEALKMTFTSVMATSPSTVCMPSAGLERALSMSAMLCRTTALVSLEGSSQSDACNCAAARELAPVAKIPETVTCAPRARPKSELRNSGLEPKQGWSTSRLLAKLQSLFGAFCTSNRESNAGEVPRPVRARACIPRHRDTKQAFDELNYEMGVFHSWKMFLGMS